MNLSDMSVAELRTLQEQVQQTIKTREKEELASAREKILAIAQSVGISLDELIRSKSHGKTRDVKVKVAVRYRHPADASLQWTGRGRKPKWIQEWVDAGKSLDELRI